MVYEQSHALNNDYSFGRYFVTEEKYNELIEFKVQPNDILISCSGVYLGKLSIVPEGAKPGIINQALLKVSLDPGKIKHSFFVFVFGSPQFKNKYFPSNRGGAIPNLPPMAEMKKVPFISPPLERQEKFTTIVERVEGLKSRYQQSLTELENLYGALSQKAFKGKLDLSRVPLPAEKATESAEGVPHETPETSENDLALELPAPADLTALQSAEGRKTLIDGWLTAWLDHLEETPFASQEFMEAARQRLWDAINAQSDDDQRIEYEKIEFSAAEYDELKTWVFEQIQLGKLKQTRNIVCINEKRQFGNRVILRARKSKLQ